MRLNDPADHALFIDHQASFDLAAGALVDGHTWEALRDALGRLMDFGCMCGAAGQEARSGGLGRVAGCPALD